MLQCDEAPRRTLWNFIGTAGIMPRNRLRMEAEQVRAARLIGSLPAVLTMLAGLSAPHHAAAHAIVVSAQPAMNARVAAGPVQVVIRFNSRLDKARSRLALVDAGGTETELALAANGPPDQLDASALPPGPGAYRLRWWVLAMRCAST